VSRASIFIIKPSRGITQEPDRVCLKRYAWGARPYIGKIFRQRLKSSSRRRRPIPIAPKDWLILSNEEGPLSSVL
jgi:hypothetical protein